jgi:hypothetical protein
MSQFPIVLIPDSIRQTKTARPPVPSPPNLPVPKYPPDAPAKINITSIGVQSAIASVSSFIIGNIANSNSVGTLLLVSSFIAIALRAWQQFNNYPLRKKKHQKLIATYRRQKKEVEIQKQLHYERAEAIQTPEKIAEFQYKLLLEVLSRTIPHDENRSNAQEGYSEARFYSYLKRYFANNIHTRLTLKIPNFDYPYSPDFAYIDNNINLYIDIEIDEPYDYKSKQPTHYLYSQKDERRNRFFIERGWTVIRFSEEQIVKYPESCCEIIAKTIADISREDSILSQFKKVIPMPKIKQWTYEEADEMAMKEYRKTYL